MIKKWLTILLALLLVGCTPKVQEPQENSNPAIQQQEQDQEEKEEIQVEEVIDEDGIYTTKDDVALYLVTYHKLPSNFITKKEAQKLGWQGGGLDDYAKDKCIGGDRFGNYEGTLPTEKSYHECDIDTLNQKSRGAKRLVYSEDFDIYYTEDHYDTFELIYEGE